MNQLKHSNTFERASTRTNINQWSIANPTFGLETFPKGAESKARCLCHKLCVCKLHRNPLANNFKLHSFRNTSKHNHCSKNIFCPTYKEYEENDSVGIALQLAWWEMAIAKSEQVDCFQFKVNNF